VIVCWEKKSVHPSSARRSASGLWPLLLVTDMGGKVEGSLIACKSSKDPRRSPVSSAEDWLDDGAVEKSPNSHEGSRWCGEDGRVGRDGPG
jgi:hypothetical protein